MQAGEPDLGVFFWAILTPFLCRDLDTSKLPGEERAEIIIGQELFEEEGWREGE